MKIGVVNAFSLPHIFRAPSTFHLCVNNRLNLFLQEGRRGGGGEDGGRGALSSSGTGADSFLTKSETCPAQPRKVLARQVARLSTLGAGTLVGTQWPYLGCGGLCS